jgi:hypothetical protein
VGRRKLDSATAHRGRVCILVLFVFLSQAIIWAFYWFLMAALRVLLTPVFEGQVLGLYKKKSRALKSVPRDANAKRKTPFFRVNRTPGPAREG